MSVDKCTSNEIGVLKGLLGAGRYSPEGLLGGLRWAQRITSVVAFSASSVCDAEERKKAVKRPSMTNNTQEISEKI
jgi:hypothetical protein